jgi:RNA polymerase sigma-70 factor (ECF subfamily)
VWSLPPAAGVYTGDVAVENESPASASALAVLLDKHRAFLRYLERRVGDRALAEDILQDAFTRNLDRVEHLPGEAVIPWFYRTLRNATIDAYRRRGSSRRALEAFAREMQEQNAPSPEMTAEICACVGRLATTLKPEYAEALQTIDVDGVAVKDFAASKGLSAGNAGVRVFRARDALRRRVVESCGTCAEHGCIDCTCAASRTDRLTDE